MVKTFSNVPCPHFYLDTWFVFEAISCGQQVTLQMETAGRAIAALCQYEGSRRVPRGGRRSWYEAEVFRNAASEVK
jgi:hypothetical protein